MTLTTLTCQLNRYINSHRAHRFHLARSEAHFLFTSTEKLNRTPLTALTLDQRWPFQHLAQITTLYNHVCQREWTLYSRTAVVPLHTQWLTAICSLQQLELKQDGLVQVSSHKRLVVEDGDGDHRGVHYRVSGKPEEKDRGVTARSHRESGTPWLGR